MPIRLSKPKSAGSSFPSYISLRTELNEAELTNIADARKWLL